MTREEKQPLWLKYGYFDRAWNTPALTDMAHSATNELWGVSGTEIWRRVGHGTSGAWSRIDGTARRIAHDGVRPWIVGTDRRIYARDQDRWIPFPVCARDVDGGDYHGYVFFIDCNGALALIHDGGVHTLGGNTFQRVAYNRVTDDLYLLLAETETASAFTVLRMGLSTGRTANLGSVRHLDAAPDGSVWATDPNGRVMLRNEQSYLDDTTPFRFEWVYHREDIRPHAIAGNLAGRPTVNWGGDVWDMRVQY